MINPIFKEQVRQRRLINMPIRKIAEELGVTKYAVEMAVKEIEAEDPNKVVRTVVIDLFEDDEPDDQTAQPEVQTLKEGAQTLSYNDQTLQNNAQTQHDLSQTGAQTAVFEPQTRQNTTEHAASAGVSTQGKQLNSAGNAEKAAFFPAIYGFMPQYRKLLKELMRVVNYGSSVWPSVARERYLKQVVNLKEQARAHCREHGVCYEGLLLSGVLEACERYLRKVLLTAPVVSTELGFRLYRFPQDRALALLLWDAQQADFYHAGKEQSSAA